MIQILKRNSLKIIMATLLAFVGVTTSFAAEPTGSSPDQALTAGRWHTLQAGESVWYAFEYDVDYEEVENKDGDNTTQLNPSQVSIWLDSEPDNGKTNFEVWTPERLHQWQAQKDGDDEVQPVGRGSADDNTPGDYFWGGKLYQTGTYYVRVTNESAAASHYMLRIEGQNVRVTTNQTPLVPSMNNEEVKAEIALQNEETLVTETSEQKEAAVGTSPNNALRVRGQWIALEPSESVWYAFEYGIELEEVENKDDDDDDNNKEYKVDAPRASIWLDSLDHAGINFEVWTPELLQQWQVQKDGSDYVHPVGRGSQDDNTPGDYFWSGEFYQSGIYYVKVTNNSSQLTHHALHLELK